MRARRLLAPATLAWLALVALSARWLAAWRPSPADFRSGPRFVVTNPNDEGPGSLRDAIFAADRAQQPAVIVLLPKRLVLKTPLPPLVNPKAVAIDAQAARCEIDASRLASGPVLEIRSPNSLVEGLRVRRAAGAAILVRAPGVRLRDLELSGCGEGVTLGEEASDVVLERSHFEANGTGVIVTPRPSGVVLRNNSFARHEQAAVWAVSARAAAGLFADGLQVRENTFEDDRVSVVLIHVPGRLERNVFQRARETAVYLTGAGAIVRENRTLAGASLGIFGDEAQGALIEGNELDHNAAVGIMLRGGGATVVQRNRVYRNGYGIAVVFGEAERPNLVSDNLLFAQTQDAVYVLGGSPHVRLNRAVQNRAALSIVDFIPYRGSRITAEPKLQDNVFERNVVDAPVRTVYKAPPPEEEAAP